MVPLGGFLLRGGQGDLSHYFLVHLVIRVIVLVLKVLLEVVRADVLNDGHAQRKVPIDDNDVLFDHLHRIEVCWLRLCPRLLI